MTPAYECAIGGELKGFDPSSTSKRSCLRRIDRSSVLAIAAAQQAVADAGLDLANEDARRVGVMLGTGMGGAHLIVENQQVLDEKGPRRVSPFLVTQMLPDTATGLVAIALGARRRRTSLITAACATGGAAVGRRRRDSSRAATPTSCSPAASRRPCARSTTPASRDEGARLSTKTRPKAVRPFERDRNGFVVSEGAGVHGPREPRARAGARRAHLRRVRAARPPPATPSTWPRPPRTAAASSRRDDARARSAPASSGATSTTSTPTGRARRSATASRRARSARVFGAHADA